MMYHLFYCRESPWPIFLSGATMSREDACRERGRTIAAVVLRQARKQLRYWFEGLTISGLIGTGFPGFADLLQIA